MSSLRRLSRRGFTRMKLGDDVELERPEGAGHALYGPVEVRGAREGETLVVRIDEVVPRDWGRTWADGETFTWSRDGDWWHLGERRVRSAPFLGVIGMPPPRPASTRRPRRGAGAGTSTARSSSPARPSTSPFPWTAPC